MGCTWLLLKRQRVMKGVLHGFHVAFVEGKVMKNILHGLHVAFVEEAKSN
jgi:hypothetical protein